MADPDPATAPDPNPAPPPLPLDAFTCPVCLELMYKPTIASPCAHAACFWCAHRAMNSFSPSSCPLCRSVFCHQAAVCAPLHRFIQASFPAEAAAREAEVLAEEAGSGVASMEVVAADGKEGPLSPGAWACAAPACGRLVARPTALLCGHVVCAACVPTGRACPACGRVARAVGGGSDAAAPHPPHPPRPCPLLAGVVGGLFPGAYAARCAGDGGGGGEGGGGGPGAAPAAPSPPPPAAPPLPAVEAAAATATPPPLPHPPPPPPRPPPPAARRPFTHFGVGCDTCGAYPIQGARWKCADCPEAIGFDVCGECVAGGAGGGAGRFAQAHTPAHRLVEVPPVRGLLHLLQDANPEMSVAQILALGALAREVEGESEEEEAGVERPPPEDESRGAG